MESVFCYVNSSFAPSLDEVVGNLHRVSYVETGLVGRSEFGKSGTNTGIV